MRMHGDNGTQDRVREEQNRTRWYPLGTFRGESLTMCDPSYLTDNSGRLTYGDPDGREQRHGLFAEAALDEQPLADGIWSAFASVGDKGDGWGRRIRWSGIQLMNAEGAPDQMAQVDQAVDSGMIGYFIGRPELGYHDVVDLVFDGDGIGLSTRPDGRASFITRTGHTGGAHRAVVARQDGLITFVLLDLR
jgi:hypothetical protein